MLYDTLTLRVPVKNYEVPKMSVMMHSFVPLWQRDKEHPLHKQHGTSSIDTMKSLSPAAQTLKPLRIPSNENCYAMTFGGDYSGLYIFSLFLSPSA